MAINNGDLFLTVLEVGKFESKAQAKLVSGETSLPVHRWLTSHCVSPVEGARALWALFYKGSHPIPERTLPA